MLGLLGEQDPRLREIQQECLVSLRLGFLRHPQTIRYMVLKIDSPSHVRSPFVAFIPFQRLTAECGDTRSRGRLTWYWLRSGKGQRFLQLAEQLRPQPSILWALDMPPERCHCATRSKDGGNSAVGGTWEEHNGRKGKGGADRLRLGFARRRKQDPGGYCRLGAAQDKDARGVPAAGRRL